jgi:hypothetical protein
MRHRGYAAPIDPPPPPPPPPQKRRNGRRWIKMSVPPRSNVYTGNQALVRLIPTPDLDPIYVHPSNLEIQGKVIGSFVG